MAPIVAVLLVVGPATAVGLIGEISSETMADNLVVARGQTLLSGVQNRLDTTRRTKEAFAQLLAADPMVVAATEAGDSRALGMALIPIKARLDIQVVDVYDLNGRELLHLSPIEELHRDNYLAEQAKAGITPSATSIVSEGLLVEAAAPIKASSGVVGVVVVGRVFAGEALTEFAGADGVLLALFDHETPVSLPMELQGVPPHEPTRCWWTPQRSWETTTCRSP